MATSDWDFYFPTWELTDQWFISPPTSIWDQSGFGSHWLLCRHPATLSLKKAWLDTWCYQVRLSGGKIGFVNTAPLGTVGSDNFYYFMWTGLGYCRLYRRKIPLLELLDEQPFPAGGGLWRHLRAKWEYSPREDWGADLHCVLQLEETGEWVTKIDHIDTYAWFYDEEIARVGLDLYGLRSVYDDTRIWGDL